jgi:DNA-directed RNA polymerase specialized sigma24 family protein
VEFNEKMIQDALLRLLEGHNVEPPRNWASVRIIPKAIGSTRYAVIIVYPPAKTALCETLDFLSGGWEGEADSKAGIWALTEPQARLLCALKPAPRQEQRESSIRTLGDLLYADKAKRFVPENDWTALVQSVAAGDQLALHALYDRTHRIVFTLVLRITNDHDTVEEATLDVFHGVWRRASTYDPDSGSVLGWVMNQARSRAIGRLGLEQRKTLRPFIDSFVSRPLDVLHRSGSLGERLGRRIAAETGGEPVMPTPQRWEEPKWEEAAPGISCKLLATDTERDRVSMLVRLASGVDYPPHVHAGVEELHLLNGELWINDHKLYPGAYNRAEADTADKLVWSETGCTCVLITSSRDLIN